MPKKRAARRDPKTTFTALLLLITSLSAGFLILTEKRQEAYTVAHVIDGDTFSLTTGERVRLLGADAPEDGACYGVESEQLLSTYVVGKPIRITEEKRDAFGRRMGLVYADGVLVNEVMLAQGAARPDYTPNSQSELLKKAYAQAVEEKIGIHSAQCRITDPEAPDPNCVVKGNIETSSGRKLYHLPYCRHYKQIVLELDRGEGYFCSEEEAEEAGFILAPDCLR